MPIVDPYGPIWGFQTSPEKFSLDDLGDRVFFSMADGWLIFTIPALAKRGDGVGVG